MKLTSAVILLLHCISSGFNPVDAFLVGKTPANLRFSSTTPTTSFSTTTTTTTTEDESLIQTNNRRSNAQPPEEKNKKYWEIGATNTNPQPQPLTPKLREALETSAHPEESQEDLGRGTYITVDWRRAWNTYQSPPWDPDLIDSKTGEAFYEIDEMEGNLPDDLVGVLYRNGAGNFGINGERVTHVLDGDGLIFQIKIGEPTPKNTKRQVTFRSKFVQTKGLLKDQQANDFAIRGVFGTGIRGLPELFPPPRNGINEEPSTAPLVSRVVGNAFKTELKNTANTHVVSFAGKLLALFEAGLPYSLDPETLDTIGEDNMGGVLPSSERLAVKMSSDIPKEFQPEFLGGAAHTAHPKMCPRTGHLIGWHWSQLLPSKNLEVTFTEWSPQDFSPVATNTFELPDCELAPHDMAITENYVLMLANSLTINQAPYLMGLKGPAASMAMDGQAPVVAHIFPRPTSPNQFEPFRVEVPPCFSIHFSHGYEDESTGHIVAFFSGWPPSDAKDFLGAWGGFCPNFAVIPPTHLWRMEVDPRSKKCVDLRIAPGSMNACSEHIAIHPNFATRPAKYVYAIVSNLIGISSAPNGYAKHCVEEGSTKPLDVGEFNHEMDAYWFGTRRFTDEPLVLPKRNGNPENEREAYLLGMVFDAVENRSFLSVFDLERDLKEGPICKLWLKSAIPHGLHGCFAADGPGKSSIFC